MPWATLANRLRPEPGRAFEGQKPVAHMLQTRCRGTEPRLFLLVGRQGFVNVDIGHVKKKKKSKLSWWNVQTEILQMSETILESF